MTKPNRRFIFIFALLVAVSIIAVLVAWIVPGITSTGASARNTAGANVATGPGVTDQPHEAVMRLLNGLDNNQPEAVWEFLPSRYQKSISDGLHEFGEKAPAELWNRVVSLLKRIAALLKAKKEVILSSELFARFEKAEPDASRDLRESYDELLETINILLDSELADLEKLKTIDVSEFAKVTGGKLLRHFEEWSARTPSDPYVKMLKRSIVGVTAETVSMDGDTAVVAFRDKTKRDNVLEFEFTHVDGKWLPKQLATRWDSAIGRSGDVVDYASKSLIDASPLVLGILENVDSFIARLEKAETPGELDKAVMVGLTDFMSTVMLGQFPGGIPLTPLPTPPDQSNKDTITIIIHGKPDEQTEDAILKKITEATDSAEREIISEGATTTITIHRVKDPARLLKSIDFGKVTRVDKVQHVIEVDLTSPQPKADKPTAPPKAKPADKPTPAPQTPAPKTTAPKEKPPQAKPQAEPKSTSKPKPALKAKNPG